MQLSNLTPFPALAFRQFDASGALDAVVAVRGRFKLRRGAAMTPHVEQPALQWSDEHEGDPHATPLLRASDLAPHRPGTDVTYLGDSVAPDGVAATDWIARIRIADRLDRALRVTGPRRWLPKTRLLRDGWFGRKQERLDGWGLSEPEPVAAVPVCWTRAIGGRPAGLSAAEAAAHPDNPLGMGWLDEPRSGWDRTYPAPQITRADEDLAQLRSAAAPAGFGPVPPWWPPRLRHAGTYDDAWRADRHPLPPLDFDDRFWQSAPPGMVVTPWLEGDEAFTLDNLHPLVPIYEGTLPLCRIVVRVHLPGAAAQDRALALDGVQFDFRSAPDCLLTWRTHFPLPDAAHVRMSLRATDMRYRRLPRERLDIGQGRSA